MGYSSYPPASGGKTMYRTSLNSGSSWTVPAGVTYVIATLYGGGGSGGSSGWDTNCTSGTGGEKTINIINTTPGASISYSIGAGGATRSPNNTGNAGGSTSMTGATTAAGGGGGGASFSSGGGPGRPTDANNGGAGSPDSGGAGGSGWIELEYWL